MKRILLASVASVFPIAFMSDTCEVVVVNGVRINKEDYDADPDKYGKIDKKATEAETTPPVAGVQTNVAPGVIVPPAPSAPDFVPQPPVNAQGNPINPGEPVPPTVPAPNALLVKKDGTKFFIVDAQGNKVTHADIEEKGYKDEGSAWAAAMPFNTGVKQLNPPAPPAA